MTTKRLAVSVSLACAIALAPALATGATAHAKTAKISRGVTDGDADKKDKNGKFVLKVKFNGKGVPTKIASATMKNMNVTCLDPVLLEDVPVGERTVTTKNIALSITHLGPKTFLSNHGRETKFKTPDGVKFEMELAIDSKGTKVLGGAMEGHYTDDLGRGCSMESHIKNGY